MDRRRFLMGMGAFAGASLALPEVPKVIFDMGRSGLVIPTWQVIDPMTVYPRWIGVDWGKEGGDYTITMTPLQYLDLVAVNYVAPGSKTTCVGFDHLSELVRPADPLAAHPDLASRWANELVELPGLLE